MAVRAVIAGPGAAAPGAVEAAAAGACAKRRLATTEDTEDTEESAWTKRNFCSVSTVSSVVKRFRDSMSTLHDQFGDIDIYLFDQILRGRIAPGVRVCDAGCGGGRNLVYLIREGYEIFGVDADPHAIRAVRQLAPHLPADHFRIEPIEATTFTAVADVVISSAVLHFARDHAHFDEMLQGTWRVLKPGGLLFCRLASSIGMAGRMRPIGGGRFRLPDGSERYLVDEPTLLAATERLGGVLVDPLKTTVVQDQRCMTTWVIRKAPA
jgi:2-polyprenyl-3-methyl-5-hydroxy-6-metoxy-1,4-benzoquinol methylase